MMKTIWHAELETRNYSFQATGDTRENAVEAIRLCWNKHAEQVARSGAHVDAFEEFLVDGSGLNIEERPLNQGFRDNEALGPAVSTPSDYEPPLDIEKLQLYQLRDILKAGNEGREAFEKQGENARNPYPPGVLFRAFHMGWVMAANPGARPF